MKVVFDGLPFLAVNSGIRTYTAELVRALARQTPTDELYLADCGTPIRDTKVPPDPRASSQLNNAVLALPTWSWPVGLGAKRTRITIYVLDLSRAIACTANASPRPSSPTPSLVFPLTLTRSIGTPRTRARFARMRSMYGRSFGRSTITVVLIGEPGVAMVTQTNGWPPL